MPCVSILGWLLDLIYGVFAWYFEFSWQCFPQCYLVSLSYVPYEMNPDTWQCFPRCCLISLSFLCLFYFPFEAWFTILWLLLFIWWLTHVHLFYDCREKYLCHGHLSYFFLFALVLNSFQWMQSIFFHTPVFEWIESVFYCICWFSAFVCRSKYGDSNGVDN